MRCGWPERAYVLINELTDVIYEVDDGLAWVTINRPERLNAFTAHTIDELLACIKAAWADPDVGVVAITGAGDRAFCTGGDLKLRAETNALGESNTSLIELESLHRAIRSIPKPVIAAVNGHAVGGGHVLHVLCDITIAADHAQFGQSGPKVGSWDGGYGTGLLVRIIGEKRAKEMWFRCQLYDAQTMHDWGLVNTVVPLVELRAEVRRWADDLLQRSPTALELLKHVFHAETEMLAGLARVSLDALHLYNRTEEAKEGRRAFVDKRPPDFSPYRGQLRMES